MNALLRYRHKSTKLQCKLLIWNQLDYWLLILINTKGAIGSLYEMNRLKGTKAFETILKRNNRMAANTALGYMAMMQGLETFEDAIEQGG